MAIARSEWRYTRGNVPLMCYQVHHEFIVFSLGLFQIYADSLEQQLKQNQVGKNMSLGDIENLSEEQIGQLYALQQEALDPNPKEPDNFHKPLKWWIFYHP